MPNNLDSVDDILNSVDSFIEGVYRDLRITPPQRLSLNCSRYTSRRSPTSFDSSSSSSTSLTSPMGAIGGTLSPNTNDRSVSPTSHRNMDADIERINRICDNVDQNLRSIGLFKNNTRDNEGATKSDRNQVQQADTSFNDDKFTPQDSEAYIAHITGERKHIRKPIVVAPQVIDLSETQTPEVFRQPYPIINDDDDDVIIVSANISPVVDLCTPYLEEQPPRRSNVTQLRRRRLAEAEYDIEQITDEAGPSMARRRRTRNSLESKIKTVSTDTSAQTQKHDDTNSPTTASDHCSPFMCPVCMDSCLQRQPTSTKCGHVFCEVCIKRAIRLTHKCPMCNTKISNTQIFRIYL